ncbi:MAG: 50S ribosomal protein L33 [Mycoplasmataceae bacterium]|nr:MAG: 50S ribosomal protein L33 [Mycoplasmataceae bacterium]
MRSRLFLVCSNCARRNYRTSKGQEVVEKLNLNKYCKFCFKTIMHKELPIK